MLLLLLPLLPEARSRLLPLRLHVVLQEILLPDFPGARLLLDMNNDLTT